VVVDQGDCEEKKTGELVPGVKKLRPNLGIAEGRGEAGGKHPKWGGATPGPGRDCRSYENKMRPRLPSRRHPGFKNRSVKERRTKGCGIGVSESKGQQRKGQDSQTRT